MPLQRAAKPPRRHKDDEGPRNLCDDYPGDVPHCPAIRWSTQSDQACEDGSRDENHGHVVLQSDKHDCERNADHQHRRPKDTPLTGSWSTGRSARYGTRAQSASECSLMASPHKFDLSIRSNRADSPRPSWLIRKRTDRSNWPQWQQLAGERDDLDIERHPDFAPTIAPSPYTAIEGTDLSNASK
jgi:hypothetical protein